MGCKGIQEGRARAILMFQRNPTKQGEQTTPAAIIIKNFPPDVGVNSNYVELITQAAAHQIAYAMEATPQVETDCQGILKHAQKELTKGSQCSMETQTMPPCYRVIRKVDRARRRLRRAYTKAHPEDKGRKPSSFTAKEANIYAADIWADPGKERNARALSERAMKEGLKHNIMPETVYYVDAKEVMKGLFEPGDHYWKQEKGHIRALNTANMMDYVIKEYLATRAATSVSGFHGILCRWDS
jgi:hypothetical protein